MKLYMVSLDVLIPVWAEDEEQACSKANTSSLPLPREAIVDDVEAVEMGNDDQPLPEEWNGVVPFGAPSGQTCSMLIGTVEQEVL